MAQMPVAQDDLEQDVPDDIAEIWDRIIGRYLRSIPAGLWATLAATQDRMAVVTEWESEKAYNAAMNVEGYVAAANDVAEAFGTTEEIKPVDVFIGPVVKHAV